MANEGQEIEISNFGDQGNELRGYSSPFAKLERMLDDYFQRRFLSPSWFPILRYPDFNGSLRSVDMYEEGG